jgi:hypothetical protein
MEEATAAHRPLEMETASRRQSATTGVWGSIGSGEIFAEGTAHAMTKWDVHYAGLARYRPGRGGRLVGLGVHAGEWRALLCGSAPPPLARRNGTAPLQRKATTNTHTHNNNKPLVGPADHNPQSTGDRVPLAKARAGKHPPPNKNAEALFVWCFGARHAAKRLKRVFFNLDAHLIHTGRQGSAGSTRR